MALRKIRTQGDKVLTKVCKPVTEMNARTDELIDDMIETMYQADGVGLAAPQVGILKRIFVIDVSEEGNSPIAFINLEILSADGVPAGRPFPHEREDAFFVIPSTNRKVNRRIPGSAPGTEKEKPPPERRPQELF